MGQAADPVTTVNLSLRIVWRRAGNFAKQGRFLKIAEDLPDVA